MSTEAMKLALEALEKLNNTKSYWWQEVDDDVTDQLLNAETALQEALAEPQPEPVAWAIFTDAGNARMWSTFQPHLQKLADAEGLTITPLYTSPPARKPLTNEEIENILPDDDTPISLGEAFVKFARAIEAAHGIKGDA